MQYGFSSASVYGKNFIFLMFIVACKVNELCWRPNVVNTLINIRKIKFIAYIYFCFSQNTNKNLNTRALLKQ